MTIDWITVSAQVVNFLILVWLLKRFLYRPVLGAMERREKGIAARLEEARERERQADERLAAYREQQAELAARRDAWLASAQEEASRLKHRLGDEARGEVDEMREAWRRQLEEEREAFRKHLGQRAVGTLEEIARRALRDLADVGLEAQAVSTFIDRLGSLEPEARERLAAPGEPLRIATAFALAPDQQSRLVEALHEHLGDHHEVEFSRSEALLCGIELTRGGLRLGWSLADYLDDLHARVEEDLGEPAATREGP